MDDATRAPTMTSNRIPTVVCRQLQKCARESPRRSPSLYNVLSRPTFHVPRPSLPAPPCFSTSSTRLHSSVDPSEVTHFNALASSWWDPQGPSRILHLMNPSRHAFIERCRSSGYAEETPTENLTYLDIGCGGGIFAESAARLPTTKSVTAIDPSPEVLRVAKAHQRRDPLLSEPGRLTYINTPIENLDKHVPGNQQYDVVSVFEVIEHVADPSSFLDQVSKHVKPGGWLIMSTIARTWTSWAVTKFMAEDVLHIVPRGTHDWAKYINHEELRNWFVNRGGWQQALVMGVMYVPGLGWKEITGGEKIGNYFFGVQKAL